MFLVIYYDGDAKNSNYEKVDVESLDELLEYISKDNDHDLEYLTDSISVVTDEFSCISCVEKDILIYKI